MVYGYTGTNTTMWLIYLVGAHAEFRFATALCLAARCNLSLFKKKKTNANVQIMFNEAILGCSYRLVYPEMAVRCRSTVCSLECRRIGRLTSGVTTTDMRRLTTGIRSEKCVVRRFRRCANVIECTYTNLDSIAYCTPRLYGIAYCCQATNLYNMLLY